MQCLQLLPTRIVGSIFFNEIINADRYCSIILTPFLNDLRADEQRDAFFQQDGATPHTARQSMTMLHQVFGERLISKGLWPPRSPDLTPLDFFMWGAAKAYVYARNPLNIHQLETEISNFITSTSQETLNAVFQNMCRRIDLCLSVGGAHFQHLL